MAVWVSHGRSIGLWDLCLAGKSLGNNNNCEMMWRLRWLIGEYELQFNWYLSTALLKYFVTSGIRRLAVVT